LCRGDSDKEWSGDHSGDEHGTSGSLGPVAGSDGGHDQNASLDRSSLPLRRLREGVLDIELEKAPEKISADHVEIAKS
jgi:hypothetical protein